MSIYDSLNGPQKEAVLTTDGPVLILAGAGSGKTRVLTHRIAYLIEELGVRPFNILAITFTNKAAQEMRERVDKLIPEGGAEDVWVSTFHSMCVRILRRYIDRIGYETGFTIYDQDDVKSIVKGILKRLDIDTKLVNERSVMKVISDCKNDLISAAEFEKEAVDMKEKKIASVYREYEDELFKNNALDFDDLLVKTVELFDASPEVLEYYQNRFRYIHVDEYQDTNGVQFEIVSRLADMHKNLCVVGDDDQSIYRFRGADIRNILSFEQVFKGAKVIKLEQNYRSTQGILDVANAVISHNKGRKSKRLWSDRQTVEPVRFTTFPDQKTEASGVITEIKRHVDTGGERLGDTAILYRTNAQSRSFEEACLLKNIPYKVVGGVNFYHRAEIKDILGYLKTIANGRDDLAVRRIVNMPKRGIGDASVEKAAVFAAENGLTLYEALAMAEEIPGFGRSAGKITGFINQISVLKAKSREMGIADLIRNVIDDVEYESELLKLDEEQAESKRENLEELINKAAEYDQKYEESEMLPSLDSFLEEVALVADIDSVEDSENRLLLMTLHGAKGLEFERVYLCGMEEDVFPSYLSTVSGDPADIEEERRLAYVGITRAKTYLTLTAAQTRMVNGETQFHNVSRFVKEIPDGMLKVEGERRGSAGSPFKTSRTGSYGSSGSFGGSRPGIFGTNPGFGKDVSNLFKGPAAGGDFVIDYAEGDRVSHAMMGQGTVIAMDGSGPDCTVTVEFDTRGVKKMKAGFAKLKKLL